MLARVAAGVRLLDAVRERALAADRDAPGGRRRGAGEHARRDHQHVLGAERVALRVALLEQDARRERAAAEQLPRVGKGSTRRGLRSVMSTWIMRSPVGPPAIGPPAKWGRGKLEPASRPRWRRRSRARPSLSSGVSRSPRARSSLRSRRASRSGGQCPPRRRPARGSPGSAARSSSRHSRTQSPGGPRRARRRAWVPGRAVESVPRAFRPRSERVPM